jgi:hypothetical protein
MFLLSHRFFLFGLLAILLTAFGCEKESDTFAPVDAVPIYPRGNINTFYDGIQTGPDSLISFNPAESQVIRCAYDVHLTIPEYAFVNSAGQNVEGIVTLSWTKLNRILKQVQHQISMDYDAGFIKPELAFVIEATSNDEPISTAKPVNLYWETSFNPSDLTPFQANVNGMEQGPWWVLADPLNLTYENWLDPWNGAERSGYKIMLVSLGYGCLGLPEVFTPESAKNLVVQMFPAYTKANTVVYFMQSAKSRALKLQDTGEGRFFIENLPFGSLGRIFCVTHAAKNNYYSEWIDIEILSQDVNWFPKPAKTPVPAIYNMLLSL